MTEKKITNVPEKHLPIKPLTRQEIHEASHERVSLITKEFTEGFNFLSHYPKSVTFFGSARFPEDNEYYIKARSLGARIASELHYTVISGGGPGIMEGANRGAFEVGGESVGLTIKLPFEQVTNPYLTKHLDLYYFFSRKVCLSFSAEAYLFFPGGFGTLDEFFEIATLVQTHKIERVPIILIGESFWKSVDELIKKELLLHKTIDTDDLSLYTITDDEDEIIELIRNAPVRNGVKFEHELHLGLAAKKINHHSESEKPFTHEENEKMIKEIPGWHVSEDIKIEKTFTFFDFKEAMDFVHAVAHVSEKEEHHPDISIHYNHVKISLSTHSIRGLSENDYIMASKIDELNP